MCITIYTHVYYWKHENQITFTLWYAVINMAVLSHHNSRSRRRKLVVPILLWVWKVLCTAVSLIHLFQV
jgi:hypothetical protein